MGIGNLLRETGVAFARSCARGSETGVAFAREGSAPTETAISFAGEKWAFWVRFSVAEVMVVSRWSASVVAEVSVVSTSSRHSCLIYPGYCRECLRPDWRFGMSGQRKYSMELRERATRMALEARADPERRRGAIKRIGGQLGVNPEALRTWVRAVEQGGRNERGEISEQEAHIRALEAENRELRRANEILKAASTFFGAELDRLGR